MIIYIVAGERNCTPGAVQDNGGLWANVGQTSRSVQDRLLDEDYKRKAAGGKWLVLAEFDVGSDLTDRDVHKLLLSHPDVKWSHSNNTEEFLFVTDDGTGEKAKEIVRQIIEPHCLPMLRRKVQILQREKDAIDKQHKEFLETEEGVLKNKCFQRLKELDEREEKLDEATSSLNLQSRELFLDNEKAKDEINKRTKQLDDREKQINSDKSRRANFVNWAPVLFCAIVCVALQCNSNFKSDRLRHINEKLQVCEKEKQNSAVSPAVVELPSAQTTSISENLKKCQSISCGLAKAECYQGVHDSNWWESHRCPNGIACHTYSECDKMKGRCASDCEAQEQIDLIKLRVGADKK